MNSFITNGTFMPWFVSLLEQKWESWMRQWTNETIKYQESTHHFNITKERECQTYQTKIMKNTRPAVNVTTPCHLGYGKHKVEMSTWYTINNSLNYQTTTIPATGGYKQIGHDGTSWLKILWNNKEPLRETTTAYCHADGEANMKIQYQMSWRESQDYKADALSISP